jgi:hypothetical protein
MLPSILSATTVGSVETVKSLVADSVWRKDKRWKPASIEASKLEGVYSTYGAIDLSQRIRLLKDGNFEWSGLFSLTP